MPESHGFVELRHVVQQRSCPAIGLGGQEEDEHTDDSHSERAEEQDARW